MCSEWRDSFQAFFHYLGTCPPGHTLDRINTNGHYEPGNVRWATPLTQANNTRQNVLVSYRNQTITLKELSRRFKVNYTALHCKVHKGANPILTVKQMAKRKYLLEQAKNVSL